MVDDSVDIILVFPTKLLNVLNPVFGWEMPKQVRNGDTPLPSTKPCRLFIKNRRSGYSTFDNELLAVYNTVRHSKFMLGREYVIFTDHNSLTYIFTKEFERNSRQIRYIEYIGQHTLPLLVTGGENVVADALLRIEAQSLLCPINNYSMAQSQRGDLELSVVF
ncbi:hypothetical protein NPIL_414261 [Nephila pilipes]|uniref:Reverse transcriptase RNase H-like domain-containing protein n=1 Tax=Nephila pilipes TaxID=299642 RepID=A0A8X6QVP7_NEPPI|nr:hypothetical protein NPIL_414261 [Nephila pilipes]